MGFITSSWASLARPPSKGHADFNCSAGGRRERVHKMPTCRADVGCNKSSFSFWKRNVESETDESWITLIAWNHPAYLQRNTLSCCFLLLKKTGYRSPVRFSSVFDEICCLSFQSAPHSEGPVNQRCFGGTECLDCDDLVKNSEQNLHWNTMFWKTKKSFPFELGILGSLKVFFKSVNLQGFKFCFFVSQAVPSNRDAWKSTSHGSKTWGVDQRLWKVCWSVRNPMENKKQRQFGNVWDGMAFVGAPRIFVSNGVKQS